MLNKGVSTKTSKLTILLDETYLTRNFREEVLARIQGVANYIYESREGYWQEAYAVYTMAYKDGTIEIVPHPNGPFANAPYMEVPIPLEETSQGAQVVPRIPLPQELKRPELLTKLYVVIKGEEVNIYPTW